MHKRKKVDICFVILHYIDIETTLKCVNSIKEHFYPSAFIVIVDNASPNNSGNELGRLFKNDCSIKVIINESNLGFAKGNNIGYLWAKENIECEFLGVINNDILFCQNNYLEVLREEYQRSSFAVLGPDIYSLATREHQSPIKEKGLSYSELNGLIRTLQIRVILFPIYYFKEVIKRVFSNTCVVDFSKLDYRSYMINPVLHGACYFFSKRFIAERNEAFNPSTFMYLEEEILLYECLKRDLLMVYNPAIQVEHFEDKSTIAKYKRKYNREKWITKENLKSSKVFKKMMIENNETYI